MGDESFSTIHFVSGQELRVQGAASDLRTLLAQPDGQSRYAGAIGALLKDEAGTEVAVNPDAIAYIIDGVR